MKAPSAPFSRSLLTVALLAAGLAAVMATTSLRRERSASAETQAPGARITGEYAEARTCDVWTGPCFANGEMNLRGNHALLAWAVGQGTWDGVDLSNLAIVAALTAEGTFTTNAQGKVSSVVYIDERASDRQAKALLAMATELAAPGLENVLRVERTRIRFERSNAEVKVEAGSLAEVRLKTGPLSRHCDSVCGNEESFYPPLAQLAEVECAKALENSYGGRVLGTRWSDPNKRSAMVGRFVLERAPSPRT